MIFGKRKDESTTVVIDSTKTLTDTTARDVTANAPHPTISVVGEDTKLAEELKIELEKLNLAFACEIAGDTVSARRGAETSSFVVALSLSTERLTDLASVISESREQRTDGLPVLIVCVVPQQMTQLGHWLKTQAELEKLNGIRLVIQTTLPATALEISTRLEPVKELNVLRMPISTEVENSGHKYHFCISPQSRRTVDFIRQLAENKVSRIYLLGGPGSGKTSLAYYYWLCRAKVRPPAAAAGNFITVNLTA